MPYFPDELRKSVIFLGYMSQSGKEEFAGSGFLVRLGHEDSTYVVTAAHVIDKIKEKSRSNDLHVRMRVNLQNGTQACRETFPVRFWKKHRDYPRVDIAAVKIDLDSSLDHQAWSTSGIHGKGPLDPNSDRELQLGDEIFFSGLFYPHGGATRNIPIVRVGNMSALREEPVLSRNNELMDVYLVEARSISGLSGCPVFIDLAALKRARQPSGGLMAAGSEMQPVSVRFRLIGVMHGHFGSDDYPSPSNSLDGSSTALQLNFGIAMVIPSEKVLEVLEDFATPPDKPA